MHDTSSDTFCGKYLVNTKLLSMLLYHETANKNQQWPINIIIFLSIFCEVYYLVLKVNEVYACER
jgi:hypothetical protein